MKNKPSERLSVEQRYGTVLASRLRIALKTSDLSQAALAKKIGTTPQMVSHYCLGNNVPQISVLTAIAQELNVSTDYLLGLTDNESVHSDIRSIGDYTGLDTNSIETLHKYQSIPLFMDVVNFLFADLEFLEAIADYLTTPFLDTVTTPPYNHVNLAQPIHDKLHNYRGMDLHDCAVLALKKFAKTNAKNNRLREYVADRYIAKYSTGSSSCSIPQHTHAYDSFDMLYSLSKQALLDQRKRERAARTKNETRENGFLSEHDANENTSPTTQNESESDFLTEYEKFVQTLDFFGISDILHVNSIKMAEQSAATDLDSSKSD